MTEPNLKVGVTVDDKTKKGIKSAVSNVSDFEKNVKSLAKTLGIAFSADQVIAFGKASVKAFLADEAAATKLATAVKNLGYGFAQSYVTDYISNLSETAKVSKDELRPAFQTLISQTGSLTQAQSLLNTAIQTSRGSGESLSTVANDLADAYVGNTKGLKKYYLGLDQATLKTKSFADIQALLNKQFSGANEQYLNTYAGQVDALGLAWQNFQETAGGAILQIASLGSGSNAKGLENVASALNGIGKAITLIAKGANSVLALFNVLNPKKGFLGLFDPTGASNPLATTDTKNTPTDFLTKYKDMLAKIAAENKKQRDAQAKAAKALTAENKKQALLKKQSSLFDIDQIQLVAALKGQLSEDDRKRAELQLALLQGNEDEAKKLTDQIANSIDQTGALSKYLSTLPDANNPFKSWSDYLNAIEAQVSKITSMGMGGSTPPATNTYADSPNGQPTWTVGGMVGANGGSYGGQVQVSVNFQGADSLSQALRDSFVSASADGSFSQINRTVGAFDR